MDRIADGQCPSEDVLEEYALGRLTEDARARVQAHIAQCAACAQAVQETAGELAACAQLLCGYGPPKPDSACPEEAVLGQYLDQILPQHERTALETHLAACRACQAALVRLYRAAKQIADPQIPLRDLAHAAPPTPLPFVRPPAPPAPSKPDAAAEAPPETDGGDPAAQQRRSI